MAESKATMSTKLMIVVVLGIAFIAGYLISRERYKPQINELSAMVIDRDEKITYLNNLRNVLMVKDGNLIQNKDGEVITVEETILLTDGSKVSVEGEITRPNGEVEKLTEGELLFMDGTVVTQEELDEMNSIEE